MFTVKAIYVSSRYRLYECAWTNGAVFPTGGRVTHPLIAQGKEPIASHWTGRDVHLLTCSWAMWIANACRCSLGYAILLHKSLWFDILWVEWKWKHSLYYSATIQFHLPNILCTFRSEICDLQNIVRFTKYSRTITCIFHEPWITHATLLQERRRLLEGRKKIVIHRTSRNRPLKLLHINKSCTLRWVTGSSDYFP